MRNSGGWSGFWRPWSFRLWAGLMAAAILWGGIPLPARAQGALDFNNIFRATVFVASVYNTSAGRVISCVGSGTLVSPDGLILTNAHHVVDGERCRVEDIAVSLTIRLDEPPVLTYYAQVVNYDLGTDLAVLRINRQIDGRVIDPATLSLPFVELGDSGLLGLDSTITVFGYAGIGNESVTFARGTVLGFIAEPRGGDRAWLKTSATILGTMSGGGAYDQRGRLIGVPTTAPASRADAALDCRRVQDTNADGLVDNRDDCIPVGGFINALRPSTLARGLVRAARLGIRNGGHRFSAAVAASPSEGVPQFGPIHFSPGVNEAGLPTTFVTQMPANINSLYLFFDYANMRPGLVYELRTTINGAPSPLFSQAPALWGGGANGLWYIGSSGQVWPNGVYEFTLFIEGRPAGSARITIGGPPQPGPAFSDVVFGSLDLQGNILGSGYVLPTGNVAHARFIFRDMTDGLPWTQVWYYEGIEIRRNTEAWRLGLSGSTTIPIENRDTGLLPGRYRVELWIEDRLATLADFVIAGAQTSAFAQIFEAVRFSDQMADDTPAGIVAESFPNTVEKLYAFVDWHLLGAGTPWSYRWLVDGEVLFEATEGWRGPESGTGFWLALGSDARLPDGSYTLELRIADLLLESRTVRVGLGQLSVTQQGQATGVRLFGQVVDAETGEGIPGVLFIVLEAEFSVEDFVWDESQIFGMSLTDSRGYFEIARLLSYGEFYSVIVQAAGYLPVAADGIELNPDDLSLNGQLELRLEMNRDFG